MRQRDLGREPRDESAPSSALWIGCCGLGPSPTRYFRRLSALELQQSFFEPPRTAALTRLRGQAPARFAFVLRAWQLITHEPGSPGYRRLRAAPTAPDACGLFRATELVREATARTFAAARDLGARAVLFETPASFSPSAVHRERLARYFETVEREGLALIWDPRGVWSPEGALAVCKDLGLVLCRDPGAPDFLPPAEGEVAYFKLQGMGRRGPVPEDDLLPILEHAAGAETFCLFNTVDQLRDAERLRALCEEDDDEALDAD
jgi:uncharacterized protein YecE (DUF72 family)